MEAPYPVSDTSWSELIRSSQHSRICHIAFCQTLTGAIWFAPARISQSHNAELKWNVTFFSFFTVRVIAHVSPMNDAGSRVGDPTLRRFYPGLDINFTPIRLQWASVQERMNAHNHTRGAGETSAPAVAGDFCIVRSSFLHYRASGTQFENEMSLSVAI